MIAVVKYNGGNTFSVLNALNRMGSEAVLTDDPQEIQQADRVIIPGVGEARSAMAHLTKKGLVAVLKNLEQPVLGICLGMQLLCSYTEEQHTPGIGVFEEKALRFPNLAKVPHMGWNDFEAVGSKLMEGVERDSHMYFAHSYYVPVGSCTQAITNYRIFFSAAIGKDNFYGVQFHPEKSGQKGERVLFNFLQL